MSTFVPNGNQSPQPPVQVHDEESTPLAPPYCGDDYYDPTFRLNPGDGVVTDNTADRRATKGINPFPAWTSAGDDS